jgi:FtsZ-binding cell division protein ZapB
MVKKTATRTVDLEPLDRLEEKITLLVSLVAKLRLEQTRTDEENAKLRKEVGILETKMTEAAGGHVELSNLREEREVIRLRVSEMLQKLEELNT